MIELPKCGELITYDVQRIWNMRCQNCMRNLQKKNHLPWILDMIAHDVGAVRISNSFVNICFWL